MKVFTVLISKTYFVPWVTAQSLVYNISIIHWYSTRNEIKCPFGFLTYNNIIFTLPDEPKNTSKGVCNSSRFIFLNYSGK